MLEGKIVNACQVKLIMSTHEKHKKLLNKTFRPFTALMQFAIPRGFIDERFFQCFVGFLRDAKSHVTRMGQITCSLLRPIC